VAGEGRSRSCVVWEHGRGCGQEPTDGADLRNGALLGLSCGHPLVVARFVVRARSRHGHVSEAVLHVRTAGVRSDEGGYVRSRKHKFEDTIRTVSRLDDGVTLAKDGSYASCAELV
jgi:hypothetical protein